MKKTILIISIAFFSFTSVNAASIKGGCAKLSNTKWYGYVITDQQNLQIDVAITINDVEPDGFYNSYGFTDVAEGLPGVGTCRQNDSGEITQITFGSDRLNATSSSLDNSMNPTEISNFKGWIGLKNIVAIKDNSGKIDREG